MFRIRAFQKIQKYTQLLSTEISTNDHSFNIRCYEGKHELDKAMKAFSGDVTFEIMWKPKFLNPDLPEGDLTTQDYLAKKIGAEKAKSALEKLPKYMADLVSSPVCPS